MIWYALLIPVILTILSYVIWHKFFIWWELLIPSSISLLAIIISYYSLKYVDMKDVEYNGYIVTEARYYESYETWVSKTCSYTTCSGSGKSRTCVTHYYDCSYCDYNSAYWVVIDNFGHEFSITEKKYKELIKKWSATPKFNELNRSINYHGSCGKDGDMYSIKWNGKIETSECSVLEKPFQNILKVNHSAFQYPNITDEQADSLKLYHYPKFYDTYKQKAILGLELTGLSRQIRDSIETKFEYLNGNLGPKNKVKTFTLIFKNKPIDIAFKQEAYWDGGNQNEVVICIGLNTFNKLDWVKVFSWCDNKRIIVDIREDMMELKYFKPNEIYSIYDNNIHKFFKYKSFKDFNYLTFEPTIGQILFVYILTIIISVLCIIFCIKNDIQ
jgi:hypothetical protein